ncbi:hypothetical protein ZIOFF_024418 [Zingiber officinale]|uniref:Uncharacterized protein n=1 Tax=Zingiber officinale TaxID=94328 RepID=A0A8J5H2C5_ZINOF|nr:hypothetical protein ZIOFF_024418 [Zingiber officinale]
MIFAADSKSLFFLCLAALVPKGLKVSTWPSAITARKWTTKDASHVSSNLRRSIFW